ncbi:isochorismatase family protein [Priestia taiwanensis]|uniref:Isochorismatase-like domain-containing protein n=1 Tax=Priestia taiwanensis TaxID=1347902 RepID=A0A917EPI7_9BACI|nr:isochorismatase family protein [Priestia taiwanensis]MBM7363234.1 nicotinamidase-related amidase [Priestia taiwanensis]GGE68774.1 hypothetical protein GCM10007140_18530 [Priestia taiwanensis]
MRALLVIDVQNCIVDAGEFKEELSLMEETIKDFKAGDCPVIFMQHFDKETESPLHKDSAGSELHASLKEYADCVIEKGTPSSFFHTELADMLEKAGVDHLFITGFQTEFCCMFTAIAAFDRGYKVTFIENATGTPNTEETYDMPGLNVKDFVGTVLHWSNVIEVLDYEEYVDKYKAENVV